MKKLKVLPSILMLITCVAILGVGVFAVAPTQNTISGTITINSANPEVRITVFGYNADGTMNTETPIMAETPARSGININLQTLEFDTSSCNTEEDLAKLDIKVTIRISNPSSTKLGVYFSEKAMSGEAILDDVKTEKQLTDSTTANTNLKAVMEGYKELVAKSGETNGSVDTTITFKLLKYMSSNASVDLTATANQMYLNIENFNDRLIVKYDADYEALGYTVVGKGETAFTSTMYANAGSPKKVKIADGITSIESGAFNSVEVEEIAFPASLKIIKTNAIAHCSSLTVFGDLPDGLETIQGGAMSEVFSQWYGGGGNLFIPKSVTTIGGDAFDRVGFDKIYVEHETKPEGWNADWNRLYEENPGEWLYITVVWGAKRADMN